MTLNFGLRSVPNETTMFPELGTSGHLSGRNIMTSRKSSKSKTQKPLATIGSNPTVEIHRAKFHPFESTKYLHAAALKKTAKANIEVGRVEGGGVEVTVVAELRHGAITKIRPLGCKGCTEKSTEARKGGQRTKVASKKLLRETLSRIRQLGLPVVKVPVPIAGADLDIPIGPVIIIIGGPSGIDFCISYTDDDGFYCLACLFSSVTLCVGPVVLN
jgi:hypothetical protein